jgi:hypothetical protein
MMRGATDALLITPKAALVRDTAKPGLLNCGWLNAL